MTLSADAILDVVERWARALCAPSPFTVEVAAVVLALPGTRDRSLGGVLFSLVPPGFGPVRLVERNDEIKSLRAALIETVTVADVTRRLGGGVTVAPAPGATDTSLQFTVTRDGAAHACAVFAEVAGRPTPEARVTGFLLRRDAVRHAR